MVPASSADPHWVEKGAGPTLLCLHGIGSSSASFRSQLDGLSKVFRVVAWDAPGYGSSGDPRGKSTLDYYADEVAGLIERLVGRVNLLGVSWGGVIAAQVALSFPELVDSLVLVSASRGSGRDTAARHAMTDRLADLRRRGVAEFAAARAPRLLSATAPAELVADVTAIMIKGVRLTGYASAASAMAGADLSNRLHEIEVPTLVICGSEDTVTGPPESIRIAEAIPEAAYLPIDGGGHLVNQEFPNVVNAEVAEFLRTVHDAARPQEEREGNATNAY